MRHTALRTLQLLAACVAVLVVSGHATAAPAATRRFDHLTTGYELDGRHRDLRCESCHVDAVFRDTPRDCATCHK